MYELKGKRPSLEAPPRFKKPGTLTVLTWILFAVLLGLGLQGAELNWSRLVNGIINMGNFVATAFPPDPSRFTPIMMRMLETFEIALVGTVIGVLASIPIALCCSRNTCSNVLIRTVVKSAVSAMRTIPDLIWALIFVISVGLGPLAGILTIAVDTIGFCARFFSERIEEMEKGPAEALESAGASRFGVIAGAILPAGFPSFVGTSLFSIEKAVRSAVILGLVGAGGIGVELSTAMSLRKFDEALMIILMILVVVITVEQISSRIRKRVI
ncbi:phosphonate ABC transporter, permease protein PhnE [Aciduricibacillus chroicocephali]|uniref:Phosphonate ABC transporter, permease protein PhnE n=1 Tax=Aciduricibacillus chroicocephali TaxID=3054939 RepID=A0ABY9KU25_9BACI|nr:phosphonate ABC transporter, permease protein PhnE [Bacillaceae bacterium 44XB]